MEKSQSVKLRALVEKENNRILFAESDAEFVDILFHFLTMPMGTIVKLIGGQLPPTTAVGCMNNLYSSVENLDFSYFRTKACKAMLLHPRNGAATQCGDLKLKIDNHIDFSGLFWCGCTRCSTSEDIMMSEYKGSLCDFGKEMYDPVKFKLSSDSVDGYGGVFVKSRARVIISHELQVLSPSTASIFSVLSKHGVLEGSTTQEMTFNIGVVEVLNLLNNSLLSRTPLTDTLLKPKTPPETELIRQTSDAQICSSIEYEHQVGECTSKENDKKICVRLMVSKSKKKVCYAEAGEDFVDILFSFLTIPLGYTVKEMHGSFSKGCINFLYNSIKDLDSEKYFKSKDHKGILLSPKIAPTFGYGKQLLQAEEAIHQQYYFNPPIEGYFTSFISTKPSSRTLAVKMKDPKSPRSSSGGGYVKGPAMFTITDDLNVTPISPISSVSILNRLKVPFHDIEERLFMWELKRLLVS